MKKNGYILVETIVAMAILSVTAVTVQRALQVAIHARGLAQDFSTAQLLLENVATERILQPRIALGAQGDGQFPPPHERFRFAWQLEEVILPTPQLPVDLPPERAAAFEQQYLNYMGRLQMEITWSRGGQSERVSGETLLSPEQAWRPPEAESP